MTTSSGQISVSASVVLYKTDPVQVARTIACFLSSPLPVSLTVVDNSPDDFLRSIVERNGSEYIFSRKNIGFGAAHNVAIKRWQGRSEYHLILNPDVTFEAGTLPALYRFMQNNRPAGLVMPRIFYPDMREQRLCKLLPTPADLFLRRFTGGLGRIAAHRRMTRYLLDEVNLTRPHYVPNLSGCFMFVRMKALQMAGPFDERYFLYLEDVDLCRRIAEKWETVFYPDVSIVHEYANESYRTWRHTKLHTISAIRYFNKWGWLRDSARSKLNARTFDSSVSYISSETESGGEDNSQPATG